MANGVNWCISVGSEVQTNLVSRRAPYARASILASISMPPGWIQHCRHLTRTSQKTSREQYRDRTFVQEPSHTGIDDRRIVFIPIAVAPPGEGRDTVTVTRFGVFFLQTSVGGGNGGEP